MTFKEAHRELQELVRELVLVRNHNRGFKKGDSQETLLLFAEAALVLIVLERFLRVILATQATEDDTLPNLLEKATSARLCLVKIPAAERARAIREIKNVRNTILHGNYEQAAQQAGCSSVADYFKRQFASEIERLFQITDHLMSQIDPSTGKARQGPRGK